MKILQLRNSYNTQQLLKHNVHLGHFFRNVSTLITPNLIGQRGNLFLFDLGAIIQAFNHSIEIIKKITSVRGEVLIISLKSEIHKHIYKFYRQTFYMDTQTKLPQPVITQRWLGGLLTNYKKLYKYFWTIYSLFHKQELEHFKKKNYKKLEKSMKGTKFLRRSPDLVCYTDPSSNKWVLPETLLLSIPLISILDSDLTPLKSMYGIPGNDDSIHAIMLYNNIFKTSILTGHKNEILFLRAVSQKRYYIDYYLQSYFSGRSQDLLIKYQSIWDKKRQSSSWWKLVSKRLFSKLYQNNLIKSISWKSHFSSIPQSKFMFNQLNRVQVQLLKRSRKKLHQFLSIPTKVLKTNLKGLSSKKINIYQIYRSLLNIKNKDKEALKFSLYTRI